MKNCLKCGALLEEHEVNSHVCNNMVMYTPIEDVRDRLRNVIIILLLGALFGYLMMGCTEPKYRGIEIYQEYNKGRESYRTAVILYSYTYNVNIDMEKLDSIYYMAVDNSNIKDIFKK